MRRLLLLPMLALAAGCVVAGCGQTSPPASLVSRAPPQHAKLEWREPYPTTNPALVFGVSSFAVTAEGWRAVVSVENRSDVAWEVGDPDRAIERAFGVTLFPNDDPAEFERWNKAGELPAIRHATAYHPILPRVLDPGDTWKGTIAAPGALGGGLWVRLVFGTLTAVGDPPEGTEPQVVWFTDHAHRLDQVAADPA